METELEWQGQTGECVFTGRIGTHLSLLQGPAPWRTQLEWQGHSRGGTQLKLECSSGGYGIDVCEKGLKLCLHINPVYTPT